MSDKLDKKDIHDLLIKWHQLKAWAKNDGSHDELKSIVNGDAIDTIGGKVVCSKCGRECESQTIDGCMVCIHKELNEIKKKVASIYYRVNPGVGYEWCSKNMAIILKTFDNMLLQNTSTFQLLRRELSQPRIGIVSITPEDLSDAVNGIIELIYELYVLKQESRVELLEALTTVKRLMILRSPLKSSEDSRILDL